MVRVAKRELCILGGGKVEQEKMWHTYIRVSWSHQKSLHLLFLDLEFFPGLRKCPLSFKALRQCHMHALVMSILSYETD